MKYGLGSRLASLTLLAAALTFGGAAVLARAAETDHMDSQSTESQYVENMWNFVDRSMDAGQGIPENAEGVLAEIRERGVLRVATEPHFPPQEFIDESLSGQARFVGSDMELARRVAERMGVELEIVPMDFSQVLPSLEEGECDLAISGLAYTPERAEGYELSKGYHFASGETGSALLIRAENQGRLRELSDLSDKIIVAQSSSLQEALTAENVIYYKEFRRLRSIQEVYAAVAEGWADAAVVDAETADSYIEAHPEDGLALAQELRFHLPFYMEGDRIAGKKGELQLLYFVNGVIDEVLESGEYARWFRAYSQYGQA